MGWCPFHTAASAQLYRHLHRADPVHTHDLAEPLTDHNEEPDATGGRATCAACMLSQRAVRMHAFPRCFYLKADLSKKEGLGNVEEAVISKYAAAESDDEDEEDE